VGAFSLPSAEVPSEVPSVQAQHPGDGPPARAAGCPVRLPQATPEERWDPGRRDADKARKLLLVRHFRGGHDFHHNSASDYLIRGKMRFPGGGPGTQRGITPAPAACDRAGG